jgi:hypothetical protein
MSTGWATAQVTRGALSGTVTDPGGLPVLAAKVELTDDRTKAVRAVQTNSDGGFSFPQLEVGSYELRVSAAGFKTWRDENVQVHVGEALSIKVDLTIGGPTEEVTVARSEIAVNTETAELGTLIEPVQMTELPLNGRNFLQLITLAPGASPGTQLDTRQTGALGVTAISTNGAPDNFNLFTVDGVRNTNQDGGNILITYPTIDSIEEFRIQTNSYSPQYGQAAGSQVTMVTKSGTNDFHGTAYEFLRNDALDANEFFLNEAGKPKPKLRYNNFGYSVGGPILKNRLFFFWSQEWRRQLRGLARAGHVPSAPEKVGDFSQDAVRYNTALCFSSTPNPGAVGGRVTSQGGCGSFPRNPLTNLPLGFVAAGQPLDPNSARIPQSQLSPAGLALLALYPDPTEDPFLIRNWVASPTTKVNSRQEALRVDYQVNKDVAIMVRATFDTWTNSAPSFSNPAEGLLWGDDIFPNVGSDWSQPGKTLAARFTKVSPTTVNTFQYSFSKGLVDIQPSELGRDLDTQARNAVPTFFPQTTELPHTYVWSSVYAALFHNVPFENPIENHNFQYDFSKVVGSHTIIAGALYGFNKKRNPVGGSLPGQPGGLFNASGLGTSFNNSANAVSDLLFRGMAFFYSESSEQTILRNRYHDFEWYLGDNWKLRPNLTLNLGFRWSFLRSPYALDNNYSNFIPALWDRARANDPLNGLVFPGEQGFNRALVGNSNHDIAPRLGIAWDPKGNGKLAIRAGFGQFFHRTEVGQQIQLLGQNPPFITSLFGRRVLDPVNGAALGWDGAGNVLTPASASVGRPSTAVDYEIQTPHGLQWNLASEFEFLPNKTIEVAYVGTRTLHEPMPTDLNQVPPQFRAACVRATLANQGCAAFRPYGAGVIGNNFIWGQTWNGDSVYHGFQSRFTARFGLRSLIQGSYTWSKQIGNLGMVDYGSNSFLGAWVTDATNGRYDRGPGIFDRRHLFVGNYVIGLPRLAGANSVVRGIFGGWDLSGVTSISSGVALTSYANPNIDYTGIGRSQLARPDLVTGATLTGPRTADEWFNTSAFTLLNHPAGALGTAGKGIIRGPGVHNWDIAFLKSWDLSWLQGSRNEAPRLQFRAEFFNAFNHTQFLNIDTNFGAFNIQFDNPANPTRIVSYLTNPSFGSVTRVRAPREIELGLKLIF